MWTVLLVEDEEIVRNYVKKLVPWEKSGFRLIGEAENGESALQQIRQWRPDLVITDILMPVVDGIELLRRALAEKLPSAFIMLTCMGEFDYARQALEYGAIGYVLKLSMTLESLQSELEKASLHLAEQARKTSALNQQESDGCYEQAWRRIREGAPIEDAGKTVSLPLTATSHLFICSALHRSDQSGLHEWLRNQLLADIHPALLHRYRGEGWTTWFGWCGPGTGLSPGRMPAGLIAACTSVSVPSASLLDSWSAVIGALNDMWYGGTPGFELIDPLQSRGERLKNDIPWGLERRLLSAFEHINKDEFAAVLDQIMSDMRSSRLPFYHARQAVRRLSDAFVRIADTEAPGNEPEMIGEAASFEEMYTAFRDMAMRSMDRLARRSAETTDHPEINRIIDYIQKHYCENISLVSMAKYVCMDKHYLSGLFKKKTGETLIHYLQKTRLQHARQYLLETDMTVSAVAEAVGFSSDNYFIKTFKKWDRVTPSDYREGKAAAGRANP